MSVRAMLRQVERRPAEVRTPGALIPGVRRIIVVRDDRLGDVVLSLPAVDAIRRAYPEARLALLVRPTYVTLAQQLAGVDLVLVTEGGTAGIGAAFSAFGADLVICVSRGAQAAWAAVRARVPHRVGTGRRGYSALFNRRVVEGRRAGRRHEVEYALSFAHRVGAVAAEARFPLSPSAEAERSVAEWLAANALREFVVLHPGTGGSCPGWPTRSYLELAGLLTERGIKTVLSVGPEDESVRHAFDEAPLPVSGLPVFGGELGLLLALLRRASLVVSNSTGPLHLAAALGTPTLGFYVPWPTCGVVRWGPYAANGFALEASCPGTEGWSRWERRRRGAEILSLLPAVEVAGHVSNLLTLRKST